MANIKIKLGILELDCEGPEEFLKAEVPNFLKLALETHSQLPTVAVPPVAAPAPAPNANGNGSSSPRVGSMQGTTETVAAKLGVKKSPDLAVAAAARLVFVEGRDSFTYDEVLAEIQTAKAYYKTHHGANLKRSLRNLVKDGVINEISADTYAFSAATKTDLEAKIRG